LKKTKKSLGKKVTNFLSTFELTMLYNFIFIPTNLIRARQLLIKTVEASDLTEAIEVFIRSDDPFNALLNTIIQRASYILRFDDEDLERIRDHLVTQFEDFQFPRSFPVKNPQLVNDRFQQFLETNLDVLIEFLTKFKEVSDYFAIQPIFNIYEPYPNYIKNYNKE